MGQAKLPQRMPAVATEQQGTSILYPMRHEHGHSPGGFIANQSRRSLLFLLLYAFFSGKFFSPILWGPAKPQRTEGVARLELLRARAGGCLRPRTVVVPEVPIAVCIIFGEWQIF